MVALDNRHAAQLVNWLAYGEAENGMVFSYKKWTV